jgi:putative MFS transporter
MMQPIPPPRENLDDVDQEREEGQQGKATPVVLPVATVSSVNQWIRIGFIFSVVCIVAGVALHVAEYAVKANSRGWLPPGAAMGSMEMGGMVLVTCGVISAGLFMFTFYDVAALQKAPKKIIFTPAYFDLLHNANWTWAHTKICLILLLAITIDLMKPATLGFIMPGLLAEYKLTKTQGAILPTIAIAGTVKGW